MLKKGRRLSADAKIILQLMKNQPQKHSELWRNAKIHRATFYRVIPLLETKDIVKKTVEGYALGDYNPLEGAMRKVLQKYQDWGCGTMSMEYLASLLGQYPDEEFQRLAWRLVPEYKMKIGSARAKWLDLIKLTNKKVVKRSRPK